MVVMDWKICAASSSSATCASRQKRSRMFTIFVLLNLAAQVFLANSSARHVFPPKRFGHGVACNCECGTDYNPKRPGAIVGGIETQRNEFPWLVAIFYRGNFHCGGSLITRRHVLTAAHCLKGYNAGQLSVVLGEHNLEMPTGEEHSVAAVKYHEHYVGDKFYNDIGIITLDEPTEFSHKIRAACLTTTGEAHQYFGNPRKTRTSQRCSDDKDYRGKRGIVAGWGKIGYGMRTSDVVQKVEVPVMSRQECLQTGYTKEQITPTMLCAGYPQGKKDACSGDSGGPLHVENRQGQLEVIGIVSWGEECAKANYPGVYTKVCDYLDWIKIQLDKDCLCAMP